jgi:hypothetical protein
VSAERDEVLAHIDGKIASYKVRSLDTTTHADHRAEFAVSMQTLSILRGEIYAGLHEGAVQTETEEPVYIPSKHDCHFKLDKSGGYSCLICGAPYEGDGRS